MSNPNLPDAHETDDGGYCCALEGCPDCEHELCTEEEKARLGWYPPTISEQLDAPCSDDSAKWMAAPLNAEEQAAVESADVEKGGPW